MGSMYFLYGPSERSYLSKFLMSSYPQYCSLMVWTKKGGFFWFFPSVIFR